MADLRPLGSEKLQGMDKINRILEIARYNETSHNVNENKADYTIQLADGNYYSIVNEKNGYIVKRGINESEFDYIEPMKNRKYHKSYSQAMKKLNLLAGELNRIHEHTENINLIGEDKKFVLKTPEASMSDMGGDTTPPPAPEPAPEGGEDLGLDMDLDLGTPGGGEEELDLDMDLGGEEPSGEVGDDEEVTFKTIQKLTGKLGQKLRNLDERDGLTSENIKYVLNSVISAVDLEKLDEEDKDDILANFEEEIDYDDMEGDLDLGGEEEMDLDLGDEGEPSSDEGELGEGARYYGNDDFGWFDGQGKQYGSDDMDFDYEDERDFDFETLHKFAPHLMDKDSVDSGDKSINNLRLRYKKPPLGEGSMYLQSPYDGKWMDEFDRPYDGEFDFEYEDDEEFGPDDFEKLLGILPDNQRVFSRERPDIYDKYTELGPIKLRRRKGNSPIDTVLDEVFAESKVDKVLSKYFVITEEEKKNTELKNVKKFITEKVQKSKVISEIKNMSETFEQELTSQFIMKENKNIKFLGKTNKNNLVFEIDGKQLKVSVHGELL